MISRRVNTYRRTKTKFHPLHLVSLGLADKKSLFTRLQFMSANKTEIGSDLKCGYNEQVDSMRKLDQK